MFLHRQSQQTTVTGTAVLQMRCAQNIDFLKRSHEPYVIIAGGDCVYKLDYNKVLDYHIQKKADITIVCKDVPATEDVSRFGVVTDE